LSNPKKQARSQAGFFSFADKSEAWLRLQLHYQDAGFSPLQKFGSIAANRAEW